MTFPILTGPPERIFGVHDISHPGPEMQVRVRTQRWAEGGDGDAPVGVLGVPVDNATGYAVIAGAPPGHWSVTTELSLDVFGPVPTDGSDVIASAALVHSNGSTGFSEGQVAAAGGTVVARVRQRGLYIPSYPNAPDPEQSGVPEASGSMSLDELFGQCLQVGAAADGVGIQVNQNMVNPMGNLHGGVGLCLAERVASAAFREDERFPLRTTSVHVVFQRPAPLGTCLRVTPEVIHRGSRLGLCRVAVSNEQGKTVLDVTVTAGAS